MSAKWTLTRIIIEVEVEHEMLIFQQNTQWRGLVPRVGETGVSWPRGLFPFIKADVMMTIL